MYKHFAANPSTLSLTVTHDGDVAVSSIKHSLHGDYAALHTGDVIQLKCRANIGTRTFAAIRWKKNTSFAQGALLPYIPGDAQLTKGFAGLINGSTCLYEKTDIIKYTITDEDSARPPSHPLKFQCYVFIPSPFWETPESSRKSEFVSVR
ncbi:hypothetical protein DPMN_144122 [Dreissena polymorpha]|uniref:Uncharacterized protein n=1 Tax=Dreissena polymorpha TaxID=45954 RepID=A0A9D4GHL0_DREPO|nr:hypothetical protein DPMN_144122 [Dreissena polymorpha]